MMIIKVLYVSDCNRLLDPQGDEKILLSLTAQLHVSYKQTALNKMSYCELEAH